MLSFKPMLASKVELDQIRYPVLASTKLDGIRAMKYNGKLYSRNGKPIKNRFTQMVLDHVPEGTDGELIVGNATAKNVFQVTTSGVMSEKGNPDVTYHFFDNFLGVGGVLQRLSTLYVQRPYCRLVLQGLINNEKELLALESRALDMGYEGLILRSLDGPYKHGRSSVKEGYLLKLKRFEDSEAEILGIEALQHNENEQTKDTLGKSTRSSHKAGKIAIEKVGSLYVRDIHTGVEFNIGSGLDDKLRIELWNNPPIGKIIKYKYFPVGIKDLPRFPVFQSFLGFRDLGDMDDKK